MDTSFGRFLKYKGFNIINETEDEIIVETKEIDESFGLEMGWFAKTVFSDNDVFMFTKENLKKSKWIKFQKF